VTPRPKPRALPLLEQVLRQYREVISPDMERAIRTPHQHETAGNPPLWLIWKRQGASFPALDSVCNRDWSAAAHVAMVLDGGRPDTTVVVERIPANHRFGSSLGDWQMESYHVVREMRKRNRLDGD